jgi:hypothetical protein
LNGVFIYAVDLSGENDNELSVGDLGLNAPSYLMTARAWDIQLHTGAPH